MLENIKNSNTEGILQIDKAKVINELRKELIDRTKDLGDWVNKEINEAINQIGIIERNGFIDIDNAMAYLELSKSTIYKLVSKNTLPHYKQGKKLIFKLSELAQYKILNHYKDLSGTSPDGWNDKMQSHCIYQQPSGI